MFKHFKISAALILLSNLAVSMETTNDSVAVQDHLDTLHLTHPSENLQLAIQPKRKYTLKYDEDNHHQSRDWLQAHKQYKGHIDHSTFQTTLRAVSLPSSMDFRSLCPTVFDQGQLGSCTANAIAGAMQMDMIQQQLPNFKFSRLFIYYNERSLAGNIKWDTGASLSDGLRTICIAGACHESMWPYNDGRKQFKKKPSKKCYKDGRRYIALDGFGLASVNQDLITLKTVLATSTAIVFGFDVYDSFESYAVATTGIVPMPNTQTEQLLGGHAVMLVGYDDNTQLFLVRNSWGTNWGQQGYFQMPYNYVTSTYFSGDFWKVDNISNKK